MKPIRILFEDYIDDYCGFKYQIPRKARRKKGHLKTMFCPKCQKVRVFIKYEPASREITQVILQDTQRGLQTEKETIQSDAKRRTA